MSRQAALEAAFDRDSQSENGLLEINTIGLLEINTIVRLLN